MSSWNDLAKLVSNMDCSVCDYENTGTCAHCKDNYEFYPVQEFFDVIDGDVD